MSSQHQNEQKQLPPRVIAQKEFPKYDQIKVQQFIQNDVKQEPNQSTTVVVTTHDDKHVQNIQVKSERVKPSIVTNSPQVKRSLKVKSKEKLQKSPRILKVSASSQDHTDQKNFQEIIKISKETNERLQIQRKQQEEKLYRDLEEKQKLDKMQFDEQKKQRALKAEQKIQEILQRGDKRKENSKEITEKYKDILKSKQLYQIKEECELREANETLQERKKKLEQIRDLHKPVTKEDILQHQLRVEELSHKIETAKKLEKEQNSKRSETRVYQYSDIYMQSEQERLKREQEEQNKYVKVKELVEQKKKFAKEVKDKFKPAVSEEKQLEFRALQEQLHHKPNFKRYQKMSDKIKKKKYFSHKENTNDDSDEVENLDFDQIETSSLVDTKELGNQYLEFAKSKKKKQNIVKNKSFEATSKVQIENYKNQTNDFLDSINPSEIDRRNMSEMKNRKQINYLKELRIAKRIPERDMLNDWQRVMQNKNMDDYERNKLVLSHAQRCLQNHKSIQRLEETAKRQEALSKIKGSTEGLENIDDYYIGAIKAKLKILEQ